MAPKQYSAAVLIITTDKTILMGKCTGSDRWDLPKGTIEAGETPLQAALRELKEETRIILSAEKLTDLGKFDYIPKKDLHIFVVKDVYFPLKQLRCDSYFPHHTTGKPTPEFCDFAYFTEEEAYRKAGKGLSKLLKVILPDVL